MAKLPKRIRAIIHHCVNESIPTVALHTARILGDDDSLPSWIKDKGAEYNKGLLQGHYILVESVLMVYGCYSGFKVARKEFNGQIVEYNAYYLNKAFSG